MKKAVIGILAHVDAGKTTLSEALLFCTGNIRNLGRVDHRNSFLDTFAIERERGITVFSKQAQLRVSDAEYTLLDTPGHADFSAEMERTLSVLDAALLVISGTDGVQSHTVTVWKRLRALNIPTFIFVNKMDLAGADRNRILRSLHDSFGDGFYDVSDSDYESAALCSDELMDEYLNTNTLSPKSLIFAFQNCQVFPCLFGSALKLIGVEKLIEELYRYVPDYKGDDSFGAIVFKVTRDNQNNRLSYIKITGGVLHPRDSIIINGKEEKVTQLRRYHGPGFSQVDVALAGEIVSVVGLTSTYPGMTVGSAKKAPEPSLEPVMTYTVILSKEIDKHKALICFKQVEEELPELHVDWNEHLQEIRIHLMGNVQIDILKQIMHDRFQLEVSFGKGSILYRETILDRVEGVGHYEPLRHYAEVHLLLEPLPRGSGIILMSQCSEDELDRNWQRLILTHLSERQHLGVLTGSPITDICISLVSGKAHLKHTEGGDFRQATYRAVRQGLMQARSILLEPWYSFEISSPQFCLGRIMTDLSGMGAEYDQIPLSSDMVVFKGYAPVSELQNYSSNLASFSHGLGSVSLAPSGYRPCRNQDEIVENQGYDPESDIENSADSIFCEHGAGYVVNWKDVTRKMHLPSIFNPLSHDILEQKRTAERYIEKVASDKELERIFERTYGPIKRQMPATFQSKNNKAKEISYRGTPLKKGPEYVLVDGYNIIFAWDSLKKLASINLDLARAKLLDILRNYQGFCNNKVILVFDAYKVKGNQGSMEHYGDVTVVYTKEAETADMYIEKVSNDLVKDYRVRVATSDGLEQIIVLSHGCLRVSAAQFYAEVSETDQAIRSFLSSL